MLQKSVGLLKQDGHKCTIEGLISGKFQHPIVASFEARLLFSSLQWPHVYTQMCFIKIEHVLIVGEGKKQIHYLCGFRWENESPARFWQLPCNFYFWVTLCSGEHGIFPLSVWIHGQLFELLFVAGMCCALHGCPWRLSWGTSHHINWNPYNCAFKNLQLSFQGFFFFFGLPGLVETQWVGWERELLPKGIFTFVLAKGLQVYLRIMV